MTATQQIKTIYEIVKQLLEKNPHLRDDDSKLIANVWHKELGGAENVAKMNGVQLLTVIAEGQTLTSADSITRARRKAQENNLHLRGEKYLSRMNHEKQVKEFIHKTNN